MLVEISDQSVRLEPETVRERPVLEQYIGETIVLGVRVEDIHGGASNPDRSERRTLVDTLKLTEELGPEVLVHFDVEAAPVLTDDVRELAEAIDDTAVTTLEQERAERRTTFVGRFRTGLRARAGEPVHVALETRNFYFFDRSTGAALDVAA